MPALQNTDIVSEITPDLKYSIEKFPFKWKISNYSKIENHVSAIVSTRCKATVWELKLELTEEAASIYIKRNFEGEPVNVDFDSRVETSHEIVPRKTTKTFENNDEWENIFHLELDDIIFQEIVHPLQFQNDVFLFRCTMIISDQTITRTVKPSEFDSKHLLNKHEHYDMTISDGKNSIPVHKEVLCSGSPVFRKMFQLGLLETQNGVIHIEDEDFDTLREFVSFLYARNVEHLNPDSAQKLYYVADKYEVHDLRNLCSQFFRSNLTVDEVCNILRLADDIMDETLKKSAIFFIQMNALSVKMTKGWEDLVKRHPKLALEALR